MPLEGRVRRVSRGEGDSWNGEAEEEIRGGSKPSGRGRKMRCRQMCPGTRRELSVSR